MKHLALFLGLALAACGPSTTSGDDDDDNANDGGLPNTPDAYVGPVGTITGTVWAPGNAPGMVPAGHEIPVFGAVAYLSYARPAPIPQEVHCEQCIDPPGKAVFSDHQGNFTIPNVVPNDYWLVIQKGQFRIEQQVSVAQNATVALPDTATTLPSFHDPDNGLWVPRIALASGNYDQMEDILGKMQIGQVDSGGAFQASSAAGNFGVYANAGNIDSVAIKHVRDFLSSYEEMAQYHIIFLPCASQSWLSGTGLSGAPPQVWENLREYVRAGGKLYVTDWSGEYADNIFPQQIQFSSDHDTPGTAWDPSTETWTSSMFNDADGFSSYTSEHAYAVDEDLFAWLDGQQGPIVGGSSGAFDASNFVVEGKYDFIEALHDIEVGLDDEGFPVVDSPHVFVIGDEGGAPTTCAGGGAGCSPLTVTFEPVGCGRVLYSTYHTTENAHAGLYPQERILLYLIMEIGVCKSGPIVN